MKAIRTFSYLAAYFAGLAFVVQSPLPADAKSYVLAIVCSYTIGSFVPLLVYQVNDYIGDAP